MTNRTEFRVGIIGSRRRSSHYDRLYVFHIVEGLIKKFPKREIVLVSGGCRKGADSFAEEAARSYGLKMVVYPVGPVESKQEFIAKAFARNKQIVESSDIVFALVADDRTGGTENTISWAKKLGKMHVLVQHGEVSSYLSFDGEAAVD